MTTPEGSPTGGYPANHESTPPHPDLVLQEREHRVQQIHERAAEEGWGGYPFVRDLMVQKATLDTDVALGYEPYELQLPEDLNSRVVRDVLVRHMDGVVRDTSTLPNRPPLARTAELQEQINIQFAQARQREISRVKAETRRTIELLALFFEDDESRLLLEQMGRVDAYAKSYDNGLKYDRGVEATQAPMPETDAITGKEDNVPVGRYEIEKARLGKIHEQKTKRRGPIKRLRHRHYSRDIKKHESD